VLDWILTHNNPVKYTDPDGKSADIAAVWGVALAEPSPFGEIVAAIYTVGRFALIGIGALSLSSDSMMNENQKDEKGAPSTSGENSVPGLPDTIVGVQDNKAGQQGKRHNSGPLAPEHGGTGNAEQDFGTLTGGKAKPAPEGSNYPPGTSVGENGISLRPGQGKVGPRIDIPASGTKPAETLHYPSSGGGAE
jgi:hypothetical protein